TRPMVAAVTVAGSAALLTHGLPHQLGLMVAALLGVAAGMLVEGFQQTPKGGIDHE
ncbi:MAG: branched-chain amino acid ABC transporter permease, partial [Cyanobacteria bacterium Co-bin13]|nr:branched-chain amino acid ABC transporter permease [Cyanobacteria bacterium Co-bin13]